MSREIRIGLLTIVAIAVLIWGYKYLLGQNLLKASNKYYIEYSNIDKLKPSDPVSINGFDVGTVQDIYLKPEDMKTIIVVIDVKSEVKLPPDTEAHLFNNGMMGSKAIRLEYEGVCAAD
ncbi:MAG: MlaD family protein, partial [Saprospiraceae bacterium]|nr:MlaD family protein [Saprospiraceae bacterium]